MKNKELGIRNKELRIKKFPPSEQKSPDGGKGLVRQLAN